MQILDASKNCQAITAETELADIFRTAVDIWHGMKQGQPAPVWKVDHLLEFPPELIPYANVLVWDADLDDYRFLFWGSGRSEMMNYDYTAKPLSDLKPEIFTDIVRIELNETLALCQPVKSSAQVLLDNGKKTQVDKVRLPFLDARGDATIILSLDDVYQFLHRYYLAWHRKTEN